MSRYLRPPSFLESTETLSALHPQPADSGTPVRMTHARVDRLGHQSAAVATGVASGHPIGAAGPGGATAADLSRDRAVHALHRAFMQSLVALDEGNGEEAAKLRRAILKAHDDLNADEADGFTALDCAIRWGLPR